MNGQQDQCSTAAYLNVPAPPCTPQRQQYNSSRQNMPVFVNPWTQPPKTMPAPDPAPYPHVQYAGPWWSTHPPSALPWEPYVRAYLKGDKIKIYEERIRVATYNLSEFSRHVAGGLRDRDSFVLEATEAEAVSNGVYDPVVCDIERPPGSVAAVIRLHHPSYELEARIEDYQTLSRYVGKHNLITGFFEKDYEGGMNVDSGYYEISQLLEEGKTRVTVARIVKICTVQGLDNQHKPRLFVIGLAFLKLLGDSSCPSEIKNTICLARRKKRGMTRGDLPNVYKFRLKHTRTNNCGDWMYREDFGKAMLEGILGKREHGIA
ncbi:hypothetical protein DFH06DRAFT_1136904 [Mycena polygramma]|nr:hypothetical protein DFH06DRAFT_1136904 [Mycena polygramma]